MTGQHSLTWRRGKTAVLELFDLRLQRLRRQHDSVADEVLGIRSQDSRWDQVKYRTFTIDHQRVTGVVAALETDHRVHAFGQPVYDLPLSLVPPLGAD